MRKNARMNPDKITKLCIDCYNKLPKSGKPVDEEWTVLSCIVQYDKPSNNTKVVSLGTGSKCIGASKMSPQGIILNDSHAEIIARRGFLLYLYNNIENAMKGVDSIFTEENDKFKMKNGIEFIFFSSQLPCGDASIIPKTGEEEQFGFVCDSKRKLEDDDCCTEAKKQKSETGDINRTGAKCLTDSEQDSKEPGINYHLLGQVRTKPGRGDRTLSVSCSDKMAKWIHLGIQGSLLDMLLCEPIYITHFVFGAGVPYSIESLNRALLHRNREMKIDLKVIPVFVQSTVKFGDIKGDDKLRPAPSSIIWICNDNPLHEVTVQGRKLGITKKKDVSLKNSSCISKYNIFHTFVNIFRLRTKSSTSSNISIENQSYNDVKRQSKRYNDTWKEIKRDVFMTWTKKPDIWNFHLE